MLDDVSESAYRASLGESFVRCFAPWSRMPPEVWAEEIYRLPNGGRFRWSFAPYVRAMFMSMFDRNTIETALELYSRGLKSTAVLLAIGYVIDQAPRRILSLWPTNAQGEKWSKDNLGGELLETTPALNFLANKGRRISSNTLLHKLFPGGLIDIFGANSPGDMRRAKGSFLYADEIDAIDSTITDEGDQLAIFNKRGDEYPDTIRVFASYPSVRGKSRIDAKFQESDGNEWFVTCIRCGGEPFVMERKAHLHYDDDKPETARLECPRCKAYLTDSERYDMAHKQGFDNWRPARPFRGKRGFHANALLWPHPVDTAKFPGGYLQMLAQAEIDANNSDNPKRSLRVLVNTVDAEPFDPSSEDEKPPDWQPLFNRRESYTAVPGLVITGAADLQLNRIEVEWKAWGRREESWGLDHVTIDGDIRDPAVWELLKSELRRKFVHVSGAPMQFSMFFIDGGFWSEWLFRFLGDINRHPIPDVSGKVRACKGVGASPHPVVTDWRSIAKNLHGYHVGSWQIKDLINRRIAMEPREDGTLPEGLSLIHI